MVVRHMSDWVAYYKMPFKSPGVDACYSLNTYGKGSEVLPVNVKRDLFFTYEKVNDLSGHNLVKVYYEWIGVPWFHFRICSDNLFFTRFNPLFSSSIHVRYRAENVRYRIVKKKYSEGEFLLAGEGGVHLFRFSQHGYDREAKQKESSFQVEFKYRSMEEKNFFLGLAVCIPEAIDIADPHFGI